MSFWQDLAPWVKAVLVIGALGVVYLVAARFIEIFPFGCLEGSHCEGIICSECIPDPGSDATQRGFRPQNAVGREEGGGEE
jgi:hypothetical protein